ncbi:MAG: DUF424 domain-containing protein [Halobacteriales archaeon]|nr:DUF424 domain-containing protein [Halobacteriales archaeon]
MLVRERSTQQGLLVTACDRDILGETFEDGEVSITVTEEFYDGEVADRETVVTSLARAQVANIVGTRAVRIAIEAGIIEATNVLEIDTTRHAQLVRL